MENHNQLPKKNLSTLKTNYMHDQANKLYQSPYFTRTVDSRYLDFAYLEVRNLVPVLTWKSNNKKQNIVEKTFSIYQLILNYILFVKCDCSIYFPSILQI